MKKFVLFLSIIFILSFFTACTKDKSTDESNSNDFLYVPSGEVIDNFISNVFSNYAVPKNGTWNYDTEIREALKKYAEQEVTYFVALSIVSNPDDSSTHYLQVGEDIDEITVELERLVECGYSVGYSEGWTYQGAGEKVKINYIAGYFTANDIENFNPNEKYGYFFYFAKNGDSSPVPAEQGIITDFSHISP